MNANIPKKAQYGFLQNISEIKRDVRRILRTGVALL